jgi:hypothetical protein
VFVNVAVRTPVDAGKYTLRIRLVQEFVGWFDEIDPGSKYEQAVHVVSPEVPPDSNLPPPRVEQQSGPGKPLPASGFLVSIDTPELPAMSAGEHAHLVCVVTNNGTEILQSGLPHPIHLSYRLFDAATGELVDDGPRSDVPELAPGKSVELELELVAPGKPGSYLAGITLVQELVAWFDEENGPSVVAGRLLSLGATPGDVSACFAYFPFSEPTLDDADELAAEMAALAPALVVFDSGADLYVASGLNENDNMDMTRWALAFSQRLSRSHGIATVVLEHMAKAGDGSYQRGAGAKKAKVDALWMLEVRAPFDHKTVGEIELVRKKDRLAHLPPKVRYRIGGDGSGKTIFERIDATEDDANTTTARLKWGAFTNEVVAVLEREHAHERELGLSQRQLTGLLSPATQTYKNEIVQYLAASPTSRVRSAAGPRNSLIYWLNKEVSDD